MNALRTLPTFPNEITDLILYQLPPEDLLAVYLVSRACMDFVNNNDQIRKKMFRLPKSLDGASGQVRAAHIQQLWQDVYDKWIRMNCRLRSIGRTFVYILSSVPTLNVCTHMQ
jgi:hypothetical protein